MGNSNATPNERHCGGFLALPCRLKRPVSDTDLFRGKKTCAQQQRDALIPSTRPRRTSSVRGYEPRSASMRRKRSIQRRSHLLQGGGGARSRRKTMDMEAEIKMAADQKQLFQAAERGDVEAVEALADTGIDVNSSDENRMTVLHHAATNARDEVMKSLIARGANVNALDVKGGFSPMHWVVINANPQLSSTDHVDRSLVVLSKAGADVNCMDFNFATPLHIAAQKGDRGCIDALIRLGANPEKKDITGRNCYEVAQSGQVRGFMEQLKKAKEEAVYHVLEIAPFRPHSNSFRTPPPSYSPPPPPVLSLPPLPPPPRQLQRYSNSQATDVPEPLYHDPEPFRVSPPSTPPPPPPRRRKQQDPSFPLDSHIYHVLEIPPPVPRRGAQKSSPRRRKASVRRL